MTVREVTTRITMDTRRPRAILRALELLVRCARPSSFEKQLEELARYSAAQKSASEAEK